LPDKILLAKAYHALWMIASRWSIYNYFLMSTINKML
jgi:hypothetical protein